MLSGCVCKALSKDQCRRVEVRPEVEVAMKSGEGESEQVKSLRHSKQREVWTEAVNSA